MKKTQKPKIAEKRLYPRQRLRTSVIFEDEWGDGFVYFYSTDISLGGLFFESELPLKQGTKVFLSFDLPSERRPVRVTGEVVRQERESKTSSQIVGTGIRFMDLSENANRAIQAYLSLHPQI